MKMKGSCVCGDVTYEVTGKVEKLYQCHCTICQKQTGSSSQTGFFVGLAQFNWLQGESNVTNFKKENGYSASFCSKCGATVPNIFSNGDKYWVPAGAFKTLGGAKIENHIFVANKAEWDEICGNATQHDGFFPVYV